MDRALTETTEIHFRAENPAALQRYLFLLNKYQGRIPDYLLDHMQESPEFGQTNLDDAAFQAVLDADLELYLTTTELEFIRLCDPA